VPHTDGWHAQTDLPIIATTACLANTVHCLQGARFKRRSGATFRVMHTLDDAGWQPECYL